MAILNVGSSGLYYDLQSALNAAQPGDKIVINTPKLGGGEYALGLVSVSALVVETAVDVGVIELELAAGIAGVSAHGPSEFLIYGNTGANLISAGDANDLLIGGAGNDTLVGGAGQDSAGYLLDPSGVNANLSTGQATDGFGNTDTFTSIEALAGSLFDDVLTGDNNNNHFIGLSGDDIIRGGGGIDTVSYEDVGLGGTGVTVNLATGVASDGLGGTDTLSSIENVIGSAGSDRFIGSEADEFFQGGAGQNYADGGGGFDTLSFQGATGGATVHLYSGGSATFDRNGGPIYGSYQFDGFEGFVGTSHDDEFNDIVGTHHFDGGVGFDEIDFARHTEALTIDLTLGTVSVNGQVTDTFSSIEAIRGSRQSDWIIDAQGSNEYSGGSAGLDTVSFVNGTSAITVDFHTGHSRASTVAHASGDVDELVWGIESVAGTRFDDTFLVGDDSIASLDGHFGTDTISFEGYGHHVPITYDVSTGKVTAHVRSGDVEIQLSNFEIVLGTERDDTFSAGILGHSGTRLNGLDGFDTFELSASANGIVIAIPGGTQINLETGTVLVSGAPVYFLENFEGASGTSAVDAITGSSANNHLRGNGGDDVIDGKGGFDTAVYALAADQYSVEYHAVSQTFTVSALSGNEGVDTLTDVEFLLFEGGAPEVSIWTAAGVPELDPNRLTGDDADNTFEPGLGDQIIDGRGGFDTVSYLNSPAGISVDMAAGTVDDGQGGHDTLTNVERIVASSFRDYLVGSNGSDFFVAGVNPIGIPDDFVYRDAYHGQNGVDTLSFENATTGVVLNRIEGRAENASNSSYYDVFTSIENFIGSNHDDVFYGLDGDNRYDGAGATDTAIYALAQDQYAVTYDSGSNSYTVTALTGDEGTDTLTNIEILSFNGGTTDVAIADALPSPADTTSDFDGDGDDDVVFKLMASGNSVHNSADGSGGGWIGYADRTVIGTGDFNGDGDADLLFRFTDGNHSGFDSGGGGPWLGRSDRTAVAVGDFNGDGDDDVLFQFANGNKHIADADSGNTWVGFVDRSIEGVGDFDGDGDDDVLFELNAGGYVTNNVDGTGGRWLGGWSRDVAGIGDFDGDGDDDILFVHGSGGHIINDGEGGGMQWFGFADRSVAGIGDFDGDGNDDILFRLADGNHTIISPNGVGRWIARTNNTARDVGDYDGDGDDDILFEVPGGGFVVDQADGGAGLGMYFLDRTLVAGDPLGIGLTSDADLV